MKTYLFLLLFVFQAFSLSSQISLKGYNQEKIDPSLFEGRWKARWISYPGEAPNVYGVYHFRKSFDLEVVPSRFIVHVSADNRYKLYVNGKLVSLGPARGDIYNWSFETVDLAPYLRKGRIRWPPLSGIMPSVNLSPRSVTIRRVLSCKAIRGMRRW